MFAAIFTCDILKTKSRVLIHINETSEEDRLGDDIKIMLEVQLWIRCASSEQKFVVLMMKFKTSNAAVKIKQEGRLAPVNFSPDLKNRESVLNLVFEGFPENHFRHCF